MSPLELTPELKKALEDYENAFGDDYPLEWVTKGSAVEDVAEIRRRIEENEPVVGVEEFETT